MKCRNCRRKTARPSHRSPLEQAVAVVLPFRPYRCQQCGNRYWGLTQPIFNPTRAIIFSLVALVVGLYAVNQASIFFLNPKKPQTPSMQQQAPVTKQQPAPIMEEQAPSQPEPMGQQVQDQITQEEAPQLDIPPTEEPESAKVPTPKTTEAATGSPLVLNLEMEKENQILKLNLMGQFDTAGTRAYLLGKDRLVLDIKGSWKLGPGFKELRSGDQSLVKAIRTGKHSDRLRIVFDLLEAHQIQWRQQALDQGIQIEIFRP